MLTPEAPKMSSVDHSSNQGTTAREAREKFNNVLEQIIKDDTTQLENKDIALAIQKALQRLKTEFSALVEQGANASPSQVFVVVMIAKETEDEVQESKAKVSRHDGGNFGGHQKTSR